jgi:protein-disulfide isomerase
MEAAEAAEAAGAQGWCWEMHALLVTHQDALQREALLRHAVATGADVARVEEELNARTHRERVLEDVESGEQNGVIWTPTFFINGRRFGYTHDLDTLLTALRGADAAIVRAPSPD